MIKLKDILLEIIETQYLNERSFGELLRFWKIKDYDKFRESLISKLKVLSDKMRNPEYKKSIEDAHTKFLDHYNVNSLEAANPLKIIYNIIYEMVNGDNTSTNHSRSSIIKNIDFSKYKGLDKNVPLEVISDLDEFMSSLDTIVDQKRVSKEKELEKELEKVIDFSIKLKDSFLSKEEWRKSMQGYDLFRYDKTSNMNIGDNTIKELIAVFGEIIPNINNNTLIYKFLESIKKFLYDAEIETHASYGKNQAITVNGVTLYKSYAEKLVDSKKLDQDIYSFIFSDTQPQSFFDILSTIRFKISDNPKFIIKERNYNPVLSLSKLIGNVIQADDVGDDAAEDYIIKNAKTLLDFYRLNEPFNRYTIGDLLSGKINKHINNPQVRYNSDIITKRKAASAAKAKGDNLYDIIMKLTPNPGVLYHGSYASISGNTLISGQRAYKDMGVSTDSPVDAVYCTTNLSQAYDYSGISYYAKMYNVNFEKAGKNHEKAELSEEIRKMDSQLKTGESFASIYKVTFDTTWAKNAVNSNKYINKYDIDNPQIEGGWFSPYDRDLGVKRKKLIYGFALHSGDMEAFLFYDMGDFKSKHKAEILISAKNSRTCYEVSKILEVNYTRDATAIIEIDKKYNN